MEKFNFDGLLQFIKEQETVAATKYGYNFNLLSEQCGTIVENSHTNILMRILQYKNRYGYVLLEDFISLAGYHEKSKTYRTAIGVPDEQSFLGLNEERQKLFLETAYDEYVIPVIKNVLPRII